MQIDNNNQKQEKQQERKDDKDKIVSIDITLNLLRNSKIKDIRGCSRSNPWPVHGFKFLERSVISTQLWLHNIEYYQQLETNNIIKTYVNTTKRKNNNIQLYIVYDFQLQLNLIFNCEIEWNNNNTFRLRTVKIIDFIEYLSPLTRIRKNPIISTIVARTELSTQHLLHAEIISIGEFRPFYSENKNIWRYYKETQEAYRNHKFKYFHHFDLYKSINYQVQKRVVLTLNKFVYLEIIIVKQNYFVDIEQYYSGQNQLIISTLEREEYKINQPHQIDYFGTLEKITTEYYPQQY